MFTPEDAYGKGPYEIWYLPRYRPTGPGHDLSHPEMRAAFGTNSKYFRENPITVEEVEHTYARMGSIAATGLEDVWAKMQGENWGRGEESNAFLRKVGTGHTSMMMGDVIQHGGKWFIADEVGFTEIDRAPSGRGLRRE
ncbi:MAG TPA: hypothetical protein VGG32_07080 [Thermoplasmata archaeon]|jgi:hypothetical protein